jgi:hypothetical protein
MSLSDRQRAKKLFEQGINNILKGEQQINEVLTALEKVQPELTGIPDSFAADVLRMCDSITAVIHNYI